MRSDKGGKVIDRMKEGE